MNFTATRRQRQSLEQTKKLVLIRDFLEESLEVHIPPQKEGADRADISFLHDGVLLCELIPLFLPEQHSNRFRKKIWPAGSPPFKQRENVQFFLSALNEMKRLNPRVQITLFDARDMYDYPKGVDNIINTIAQLATFIRQGTIRFYGTTKGGSIRPSVQALFASPDNSPASTPPANDGATTPSPRQMAKPHPLAGTLNKSPIASIPEPTPASAPIPIPPKELKSPRSSDNLSTSPTRPWWKRFGGNKAAKAPPSPPPEVELVDGGGGSKGDPNRSSPADPQDGPPREPEPEPEPEPEQEQEPEQGPEPAPEQPAPEAPAEPAADSAAPQPAKGFPAPTGSQRSVAASLPRSTQRPAQPDEGGSRRSTIAGKMTLPISILKSPRSPDEPKAPTRSVNLASTSPAKGSPSLVPSYPGRVLRGVSFSSEIMAASTPEYDESTASRSSVCEDDSALHTTDTSDLSDFADIAEGAQIVEEFDTAAMDDDDDFSDGDWSTEPDYVNKQDPYYDFRSQFVNGSQSTVRSQSTARTLSTVRSARSSKGSKGTGSNSGTEVPYSVAFGKKRGECMDPDCDCDRYQLPPGTEGGPCQNCGHYPTKHRNMGSASGGGGGSGSPAPATPPKKSAKKGQADATELIGNWRIDYADVEVSYKIGDGSFGEVFRGMLWGKEVAVKKIKTKILGSNTMKDFVKELNMMSSLRHPNVVLFMGACVEKPNLAIITEYLKWGSVWDVLQSEHEMDWEMRIRIAKQTALGMNYLHRLNIIHRDLKTRNALCDEGCTTIKVADFGISRVKDWRMTGEMGTPAYMSPELFSNESYDEKSDVYSFGMFLWELMTRQEVFSGYTSVMQVAHAVLTGERPPIPSDCPTPYAHLMQVCWDRSPAARPSFDVVLKRIQRLEMLARPAKGAMSTTM